MILPYKHTLKHKITQYSARGLSHDSLKSINYNRLDSLSRSFIETKTQSHKPRGHTLENMARRDRERFKGKEREGTCAREKAGKQEVRARSFSR